MDETIELDRMIYRSYDEAVRAARSQGYTVWHHDAIHDGSYREFHIAVNPAMGGLGTLILDDSDYDAELRVYNMRWHPTTELAP